MKRKKKICFCCLYKDARFFLAQKENRPIDKKALRNNIDDLFFSPFLYFLYLYVRSMAIVRRVPRTGRYCRE